MAHVRTLPHLLAVGALLCSTTLLAQAPAARIVDRVDESKLVTLKGTVHPLANAANDRGAVPENMQLDRMHLVLKRSQNQEAALRQRISDMHTPGTASYHKWLTPEEFGKEFGPSDQDIATVQAWLSGHGFSVGKVNPGRQTLEISGNAAQLRSAFHTQVHQYQVNGEKHFANANEPQIPAALAPVVGGFVVLNNFRPRSYAHLLGKADFDQKTHKATPKWTWGDSNGWSFVLAPGDYAVQYDLNPLYQAGTNGTGQTIAIVNESNVNVGLVNQFRSLFGLPANPPQVIIDGNDPGIDGINNPDGPNGASVEAYLDVEWSGAVAPNATIDLVIAADTLLSNGLFLAAERAVYGNVAPIISVSFGNCESSLGSTNQFLSGLWEQAAAQGITVMISSGDSGSAGCDDDNSQYYAVNGQAVNGFASTPYNVAVGGTDFYYSSYASPGLLGGQLGQYWNTTPTQNPAVSLQKVIAEQPWNDSQFGLNAFNVLAASNGQASSIAAGSGGASNSAICPKDNYGSSGNCLSTPTGYLKPVWQSGTGVPNDGVRDLPDVSLFAANGVNYSYYALCAQDGDCQMPTGANLTQISGVGGTSAAAPSFAGVMALVNQLYGPQGQANFVLYPMKAQFPAAFHDVTHGTNSVPCSYSPMTPNCIAVPNPATVSDPTYGNATEGQIGSGSTAEYNAAAGYNLATGLGTIDATQLVNNWGSVKFASTTTTFSPSSTTLVHGAALSVSGKVTGSGTPTGDVALMSDSTEPVNQGETYFTLSNGSYSGSGITWMPGGTYNIWAQYSGDAKNSLSTSPKTQITVSPEASGVFLNIFYYGNSGLQTLSSGTTGIPYGTMLTLSGILTPSKYLSAYENCFFNGTNCPPSFQSATGTVTFQDNGKTVNILPLNAQGEAEYTPTMGFSAGAHSITASYSGDNSYNPSTAATAITFSVVPLTPGVYVTTPYASYPQGQTSTLTIVVEGSNGAAPTGTVTLKGAPTGTPATATLSTAADPSSGAAEGLASVQIPATAPSGSYTITASYAPDAGSSTNYAAASTTASLALKISASSSTIATTTTASASAPGPTPNAQVTITGTVTAKSGSAPTGSVQLLFSYVNGASASEVYADSVALVAGSGTQSTFSITGPYLNQGTNVFTILYVPTSGSQWQGSTTVLNVSNPMADFTLVPQTTTAAVKAGTAATDNIYLGSVNGFSGAVSLSCSAPSGVTCQIASSVSLASNGSGTAALTLNAPTSTANGSYNVLVTGMDATMQYVHTLGIQAAVSGGGATKVVATPTFNPAGGSYSSAQTVTISDATAGATIYFTTDGTTPTANSPKYGLPIQVSASETLSAMATASGYTNSGIATAAYTIATQAAATPTFAPAGGTYTAAQTVTISDATKNSTIYYTTDGSTPTTTNGTKYTSSVKVTASETLNAIATATGYMNSAVGTAVYTITLPTASTPTFAPAGGAYTAVQTVTISDATKSSTIYFTTDGSTPTTTNGTKYTSPVKVTASETLSAIATATGYMNSAVGTAVYAINIPVAVTPTFSPAAGSYTGTQSVVISDATPGSTIYYTTNGQPPTTSSSKYSSAIKVSVSETLSAIATATGYTTSGVGTAAYTITAATPTFTPAAGNYTAAQNVTISDATTGATIYYTTDGTTPSATNGTKYSSAVKVGATETLNAIAVATGETNSAVATAKYTITLPVAATPKFTPAGATYTSAQTVTISDTTTGATIYYTTDGSTPSTTHGTKYTSAIKVGVSETLSAIAVANGYTNSAVGTAVYTINLPTATMPTFSPIAGTYSSTQTVSIKDTTPGATIYYTTNGTTPTVTGGTKYNGSFKVSTTETVEAIAAASGYNNSAVATAMYTIGKASAIRK